MSATAGLTRRRLTSVLITVLCLALSAAAYRTSQVEDDFEVVSGRLGEAVRVEKGWARVEDVRVGTALADGTEIEAHTAGLFVVARVTVGATRGQDLSLGHLQAVTRDRTYQEWASATVAADPGFQASRDVVVEVDPQQIDDLTLQLWRTEVVSGYQQHVFVHLGITAENAQVWRDAGRDRVVDAEDTPVVQALP